MTNAQFYDAAAEDIGKDIGRMLFWRNVRLVGKWIAEQIAQRVEIKTAHVIEIAVDEGKLLALPLEKNHAELEPGEIVTVNRKDRYEVLQISDGRVVLG